VTTPCSELERRVKDMESDLYNHGNGLLTRFERFEAKWDERRAQEDRREAEKEKQLAELEANRKARVVNRIAVAAIIVGALVVIMIALCGSVYTNVLEPILKDIYSNHPKAHLEHQEGQSLVPQVFAAQRRPTPQATSGTEKEPSE
jgi:hypothetical protein